MAQMASNEIQKNINLKWSEFKSRTGTSQFAAAKRLGMNQSAFSQYLRGAIPLNRDFIVKFCKLTGTSLDEIGYEDRDIKVRGQSLAVKYATSGRSFANKSMVVETLAPASDFFGVLVDTDEPIGVGNILLVSEVQECREGDFVLKMSGGKRPTVTFGKLLKDGSDWVISKKVDGVYRLLDVDTSDTLKRITGSYIPEPTQAEVYVGLEGYGRTNK